MSKIAKNITELIGNTPLLELSNYGRENGLLPPSRFTGRPREKTEHIRRFRARDYKSV